MSNTVNYGPFCEGARKKGLRKKTGDKKMKFKALIRVVKSIAFKDPNKYMGLDIIEVMREPLIEAKDKSEVKAILLDKYPQFFQNGKVYERETKDQAQFFYRN